VFDPAVVGTTVMAPLVAPPTELQAPLAVQAVTPLEFQLTVGQFRSNAGIEVGETDTVTPGVTVSLADPDVVPPAPVHVRV
jgi:hypothetical protein